MNRPDSPESAFPCSTAAAETRKPPWIRVRLPGGSDFARIRNLKETKSLHTVCEAAECPNIGECWACGHATFMILGDICTRDCRFCAVAGGRPLAPQAEEPRHVAEACAEMGLRHAVITSVTRDDLPEGGASVFADTIREIRRLSPQCSVEVLIPDFRGDIPALEAVLQAAPDILGHNVETVPRLYARVRPQAIYPRSLDVLGRSKALAPEILTKSGLMLGLGETVEDLHAVFQDLRSVGCDILTLGQYLRPSKSHLPVHRYYPPEEFERLAAVARELGFKWVEAGPLVRSSYRAGAAARELLRR